ncbi:hypothetical protein CEXT_351641 [Caerostris extrusa]|uniref:Uncharacterized protein n=1 Tax=Caerostris extrusa TaxID=172846 RepID=A0AAV4VAF9_CAEEX|nr:hypothetical protein CEXT_351641 [Caerostris extrusa]
MSLPQNGDNPRKKFSKSITKGKAKATFIAFKSTGSVYSESHHNHLQHHLGCITIRKRLEETLFKKENHPRTNIPDLPFPLCMLNSLLQTHSVIMHGAIPPPNDTGHGSMKTPRY